MGASMALAGLTSCRWPEEKIVPFSSRPEGRTPGVPERFATAMELGGSALGLVVTSFDGRPVKAEGNSNHPDSLGALSAVAQASVLELYDPDRSRSVVVREQGQEFTRSWDQFLASARERLAAGSGGEGAIAVLAEQSSSPSLQRLRQRFLEAVPQARWYEYEPISGDNEREGARLAFGRPLRAHPHLDAAAVIACLDADPLLEHPAAVRLSREFAQSRHPGNRSMSRLYVAESSYTVTGAMADHRLPQASSQVAAVLAAVAGRLVSEHGLELPDAAAQLLDELRTAKAGDVNATFVNHLAGDLAGHRGAGLILVGPRQEPAVHALAQVLNHALFNVGVTVTFTPDSDPERRTHLEAIRSLTEAIRAGVVQTLLVLGGNPAYDAPAELGFAELLDTVPFSAHLSPYRNETSSRCTWHLPRAHFLESWGDGRAWDGTVTMVQPLIRPLHGGRSAIEVLAAILGEEPTKGHDIVRETLRGLSPAVDFERWWRKVLHDGVVEGSGFDSVDPTPDDNGLQAGADALGVALAARPPSADRLELNLVADSKVHDGRYANNGWLQELPQAISKITWDNALLIAPPTAHALGVADGEVVELEANGSRLELPLYVLPGQAPLSLTLALGYGRSAAGRVGNGVGANAYVLRSSDAPHVVSGVRLKGTGRRYRLATTQDHHAIDTLGFEARNLRIGELVREATLDHYLEDPHVIEHQGHHPPLLSLWKEHEYQGEQWGMAVDLNACIGCNACVIACQAENNVPVVGRQQVLDQREMHWIRVDRYFRSEPGQRPHEVERAAVVFQPVACVQCENAPCEQVCPVAATQHTRDGLNAMAYNRCIGTRYCANNCPFKVRRFNFFNYHKELTQLESQLFNPEVTVRSRGVMEKCTFCVQRIEAARIVAGNERRAIGDGEIVPACAQTCPAQAITFGNLNDPASAISRLREDHRGYALLAELNIRPRTQYLARLRNPADRGKESG
jgi:molybdopterin-containing oxidoreductase family iron-sulfur binding subunit